MVYLNSSRSKHKELTYKLVTLELAKRGVFMIKLIVFDLDNTLAKVGKGITPMDIELLKQIEKTGIRIAICSGKPTNYLCGFMRQVGLVNTILLGENGAVIQFGVDLPPKQFYSLQYSQDAKDTISFLKEKIDEICPNMWYQPNLVGLTPFPKNEEEFEKIAFILNEHKENLKDVMVYRHVDSFDITPKGVDKRKGLQYLGELLNITSDETLAVGDGINDYPMFAYAGYSIGVNVEECERVNKNFTSPTEALEYILLMGSDLSKNK